ATTTVVALTMRREGIPRRLIASRAEETRRAVEEARGLPVEPGRPDLPRIPAAPATPRGAYLDAVRSVLGRIARGDLYQVNLSHRISCRLREPPLALFERLATGNPAPFAAYLDTGPFQVACASPERFVSLRGDRARSSPIKGTR